MLWYHGLEHTPREHALHAHPQVTQYVVGTSKTLPFWERCFGRQPFFLTARGTAEHELLWLEGREELEGDPVER